jgi:hypothetical protein
MKGPKSSSLGVRLPRSGGSEAVIRGERDKERKKLSDRSDAGLNNPKMWGGGGD